MIVRAQKGFGLVEIMVGLLIGMFGVVVMMQTLSISDAIKRTSNSGGDALNEGAISLYTTQVDLKTAGYGITNSKILGCTLTLRSGVSVPLAPVSINPSIITGADAATDSIIVVAANGSGSPNGDSILSTGATVQTPSAFVAKDMVTAAPATRAAPCNLSLDSVDTVAGNVLTLASGSGLPASGTLFNLGQSLRVVGYSVRAGRLTSCDYMNATQDCTKSASWKAVGNNIVSLKAQYGRDTATAGAMDGIVDIYDRSTPDPVALADTSCNWARISSIRFALVVRSVQYEKEIVTNAAPVWDGSVAGNPTGSEADPIDLTALTDWQHYRYKTFQTLTPLRNVSWLGVPTGC